MSTLVFLMSDQIRVWSDICQNTTKSYNCNFWNGVDIVIGQDDMVCNPCVCVCVCVCVVHVSWLPGLPSSGCVQ